MTIRSIVVIGFAALALGGLGCSDPCGDLKAECEDCADDATKSLCEATVDAIEQVGGDDLCQDTLDAGFTCDAGSGGSN
jgi:hypothetical protein